MELQGDNTAEEVAKLIEPQVGALKWHQGSEEKRMASGEDFKIKEKQDNFEIQGLYYHHTGCSAQ